MTHGPPRANMLQITDDDDDDEEKVQVDNGPEKLEPSLSSANHVPINFSFL